MMFNKDQAEKLRDLAQSQGVAHKEEPLTYSAIMGEDRRAPAAEGHHFAVVGVVIASAALVIFGVVLAVFFILQHNDVKYKEIISSMDRQGAALKSQLESVTEKTRQLEGDLALNAGKNQELINQVRSLDGTNAALNSQLALLASERKQLLQQIGDTRAKAAELEQARQSLQEEMRKSQAQMQGEIASLNSKLAVRAPEPLPLAQVARPEAAAAQIVLINRQEGFVLINGGTAAGYKKGQRLVVTSRGSPVAELVVNEARDQVSACDVVSLTQTLQLGDEVRVR